MAPFLFIDDILRLKRIESIVFFIDLLKYKSFDSMQEKIKRS